jgi:hypothetical protein
MEPKGMNWETMNSIHLAQKRGLEVGSHGHCNEPTASVKKMNFLSS